MPRRHALASALLAGALALSGCSGEGSSAEESAPASPVEQLAAAQATLEATNALTVTLTSVDVPTDVNGVRSATGVGVIDGATITFAGEVEARITGISATVEMISINEDAYMKLFTPEFAPVDLEELGAPNPTSFFAPTTGIASLIAATTDVAEGGKQRAGREILTEITGTLPGEKIEGLLRLGGPGLEFDVTYGLTTDLELRRAVLEGEFYEGTRSVYTLVLTDYGQAVPIERPTGGTGLSTDAPTPGPTASATS